MSEPVLARAEARTLALDAELQSKSGMCEQFAVAVAARSRCCNWPVIGRLITSCLYFNCYLL